MSNSERQQRALTPRVLLFPEDHHPETNGIENAHVLGIDKKTRMLKNQRTPRNGTQVIERQLKRRIRIGSGEARQRIRLQEHEQYIISLPANTIFQDVAGNDDKGDRTTHQNEIIEIRGESTLSKYGEVVFRNPQIVHKNINAEGKLEEEDHPYVLSNTFETFMIPVHQLNAIGAIHRENGSCIYPRGGEARPTVRTGTSRPYIPIPQSAQVK